MDLREFGLTRQQINVGCKVLKYQPFILSDDVQTGIAYSWRHIPDPRLPPALVFYRRHWRKQWDEITESNALLRRTYDGLIRFIASRYPGKTLLDVACNNGYFPVRAELFGMAPSFGMDIGGWYRKSVALLNSACGTHATFTHAVYDPGSHRAPLEGQYDVVVASAIMCHLPDPLNFLAFLASKAKEAIFFWGQLIDSSNLLVSYQPPHAGLHDRPFPFCFNDNTRISRGLMELSFKQLGFKHVIEVPWQHDWLSPYITQYRPAELDPAAVAALGEPGARASQGFDLLNEIEISSKHVGILATR
ncbi:MAG TPA: methyltransferase domain-containing protein [Pirellulales bacterium]